MKQTIISQHGSIKNFARAIGKNYLHVARVVRKSSHNEEAKAKVMQWLGSPLRLRTRAELQSLIRDPSTFEKRVQEICPKASLAHFFNYRSAPKIVTPLYRAICITLGISLYKNS